MTRTSRLAALTLAACLLALPAAAELSAEALWQNWQDIGAAQGRVITAASQTRTGGTLALSGISITQTAGTRSVTSTLSDLRLSEGPGGIVTVLVPTGQQLVVTTHEPGAADVIATFALGAGDLALTARGDLPAPDYALSAPAFALDLVSLRQGPTDLPAHFTLGLTDLTGTLSGFAPDAASHVLADLAVATATTAFDVTDPATGQHVDTTITQTDSRLTADITPGADISKLTAAIRLLSGPAEASSRQTSPMTGTVETVTKEDSSALSLDIAGGRADLTQALAGLEVALSAPQLPVSPVQLTMKSADIGLSVPIAPAPDSQPASLTARLADLIASDTLWNTLDPNRILPRTPAQLTLDLSADLKLDPAVPGIPAPAPVIPQAVRINALSLSLAGAELNASGKFTLPAPGPLGIPDFANPVGSLDVMVKGAETLLNQLTTAGLLGADQAMMAQMMMGIFTTPGDGDTLTSRIVTQPDGGLLVNGNRLK